MARAMRASGLVKPKATRVRTRILVLVDSMNPFDRPWSRVALMVLRCLTIRYCRTTDSGIRQRRAQLTHRSRASLPASSLRTNTRRRPSLSR